MAVEDLLRQGETLEQLRIAFMKQTVIDNAGCWYWAGARDKYGQFRGRPAHCVSWELHQGPIPEGLYILHGCNIVVAGCRLPAKGCVNPAHLRPGTPKENSEDVVRARALARRAPRERTSGVPIEFSPQGEAALRWQGLADHYGLSAHDLFFKKIIPEVLVPWLSKEFNAISTRYPVAIGRAFGGSRLNAELVDPVTGATCVASADSLPELRAALRRELGECLGDPALGALSLFDEDGKSPDVCALLDVENADEEEPPGDNLPPALR